MTGGINYVNQINLLRIYGNLRWVVVKCTVEGVQVSTEEGTVRIRFCIQGCGMLRWAINYIPKQLYKKENIRKHAPIWMEAISTYHVDEEGKIYRHILDNKDEDKGGTVKSTVEEVKEKLQKLREKAPVPSPAL